MNEAKLVNVAFGAAQTNNQDMLTDAAEDLLLMVQDAGLFPSSAYDKLLTLIQQKQFQTMRGSHHLFLLFEQAWSYLTDEQKQKLLPVIEDTYSTFADSLTWFVITELLGEYFANEQALLVLIRLEEIEKEEEEPRSLIPHGLEHLIKSTEDANLAKRAYKELESLKVSESEQVRAEAALSLQRLNFRLYRSNPTTFSPC